MKLKLYPLKIINNDLDILIIAMKYFQNILSKNNKAIKYLLSRGIHKSSIIKYRIGYDDGTLARFMTNMGIDKESLLRLSLVNEKGNDYFYKRILLPIEVGICKKYEYIYGFIGRSFGKVVDPKYKRSVVSDVYYNSHIIWGEEKIIAITEGPIDAILVEQCGIPTVALMGTHYNLTLPFILNKYKKKVLLMFDADDSGRKVAEKLSHKIKHSKIIEFPEGEDPASFINKYGKKKMQELIGKVSKKVVKKKVYRYSYS